MFTYWPNGAPRRDDIAAFEEGFGTLGYRPCDDGSLEPGYEKVVLYESSAGKVTHAARQLPNGRWTSKLGSQEDISHDAYALEGAAYGSVARFLARRVVLPSTSESGGEPAG